MRDFKIRNAQADDLPTMQEIARRTIDKTCRPLLGDNNVDWFINSGASDREIRKHINNCDVLLKDDALVAFAIYFDDLIHLMMVDVSLHRKGFGSRLLAHCERRLFTRGAPLIRLDTFEGHHQALNFYRKNGWSVAETQEDREHGFAKVLFEKEA